MVVSEVHMNTVIGDQEEDMEVDSRSVGEDG